MDVVLKTLGRIISDDLLVQYLILVISDSEHFVKVLRK
jgi:hypothetical protein